MAWLVVFFAVPLAIIFVVSLGTRDQYGGVLFDTLGFRAYGRALEPDFLPTVGNSLRYAGLTTLFSILISYPVAYWISRYGGRRKVLLLVLVMLPFWTSWVIRTYAWMTILGDNGVLNGALVGLGVIDEPIPILNTDFAVVLGMTYGFLPFAILPLYVSIDRLDPALVAAARDLYADGRAAFLHVTLPLTMPGIIAAALLTFIPAIGDFVTPDLLGGAQTITIAKVIQMLFMSSRDWPFGAALELPADRRHDPGDPRHAADPAPRGDRLMGRDRNPRLALFTLAVYVFLFAPIVILIIFSFNDCEGPVHVARLHAALVPGAVRRPEPHARTRRHAPGRRDRRRGDDDPGHPPGAGAGAPAPGRGRGRRPDPPAHGHPRGRDGDQPAALLLPPVQRQRVDLADRDRPHRILDLVRGDHRPCPGRVPGPPDGGGSPGPRGDAGLRLLPRHPAAARPGRGGRSADRLRPVV